MRNRQGEVVFLIVVILLSLAALAYLYMISQITF